MKDQHTEIDGWDYTQFGVADTVLSAEKKIKWYDEERIENITQELKERKCRVFWDMEGDYYGARRKNTRVEIYKKFSDEISFRDKILIMRDIIKNVGL